MNWDTLKGNWKQMSGKVKQQWGKLTDDQLTQINGQREELVGRVQEAYGIGRDEADKWRGRFFLVRGAELPPLEPDEVYVHDLYGMRVELTDGAELGVVETVYELPQGLGLDVRRTGGGSVVLPWRPEVVRTVDAERRVLVVDPPPGLLD